MSITPDKDGRKIESFADAARGKPIGAVRESLEFLRHTKKWWITPIVIVLLLVGLLVVLSTTAVAPFIYSLF